MTEFLALIGAMVLFAVVVLLVVMGAVMTPASAAERSVPATIVAKRVERTVGSPTSGSTELRTTPRSVLYQSSTITANGRSHGQVFGPRLPISRWYQPVQGDVLFCYVTFRAATGDCLELLVPLREFEMLAEGDRGEVVFAGRSFLGFRRKAAARPAAAPSLDPGIPAEPVPAAPAPATAPACGGPQRRPGDPFHF